MNSKQITAHSLQLAMFCAGLALLTASRLLLTRVIIGRV